MSNEANLNADGDLEYNQFSYRDQYLLLNALIKQNVLILAELKKITTNTA